ncbi:MAG: GNAT family N-acetyltransferase [Halohasta sp.]
MSVTVEKRIDEPGDTDYVDAAWHLKEYIRRAEGVLKQRRGFFVDAYRRSTTHLFFEDGDLVAFASVRRDGYILFLAVRPDARGRGYGKRLIAEIAEDHRTVTCHARTTNEEALGFYEHLGFRIHRRIDNYYEDNGDAFYLKLGADSGLRKKVSEFFGR